MAGGDDDSAASAAPPAGQNSYGGRLPSLKLRCFEGERADYEEWKREVSATQKLYQVDISQMATLVYLSLTPGVGKPRDLLSHMTIEEIMTDDGYKAIWECLDTEYEKESYVKAEDALTAFERVRRQPNDKMEDFLMQLRRTKRIMEKEDAGTQISDVSFARRMLKRSGLNRIEQRGVLAACGAKYESNAIEAALKLMYGDAHMEDKRRTSDFRRYDGPSKPRYNHFPAKDGHGRRPSREAPARTYETDAASESWEEEYEEDENFDDLRDLDDDLVVDDDATFDPENEPDAEELF